MARRDPIHSIDSWSTHTTPAALLVGLTLLATLPAPVGQWPLPNLVLIGVYITAARRPASTPASLLFGLGLVHDLLGSTPLGFHALEYVLVHAVTTQMRLSQRSFVALWIGFVPPVAVAALVTWAAMSLHHMVWVQPDLVWARAVASAIAFPVLAVPMLWIVGGPQRAA